MSKTLIFGDVQIPISTENLPRIRGMFQVDIISKLMMYIEDFVVICESMLTNNGNFYEILETGEDLGQVITRAISNFDSLTDTDFRRILCYINPDEIINYDQRTITSKLIDNNVGSFKVLLRNIENFRNSHIQIFRRYKHAGTPIRPNASRIIVPDGSLSKFDSVALVFTGKYPLREVTLLPYSEKVITEYKNLSMALEAITSDIVQNRISCLERNVQGIIPFEAYGNFTYTVSEHTAIESAQLHHFQKNPILIRSSIYNPHAGISEKDFEWYRKLG